MATAEVLPKLDIKQRIKDSTATKPKTKPKVKPKEHTKEFWKNVSEFEEKFYSLMFELNLYNKFEDTYTLNIMEETEYGFYAQLYLKTGLTFTELKEKQGAIQENLQCLWIMKTEQFRSYADIQIVTKPLDPNFRYVNPNIKPWEMYMGLNFTLNPIINKNVNELCMFLLSGSTRSGKTMLIYMMLLSWILSCTPQEVELYITDVAKDEYINLEFVEHVKCYSNTIEKLHAMMIMLKQKFNERKRLMSKLRKEGKGTNIVHYNKYYKNNKLAYCYLLIDELSIIMPDNSDNPEDKDMKNEILDIIKLLEKTGAGMGMFVIAATQKTSKEEMIPIIKNMSSIRISLRANDRASSEVIMGDSSAVGLANRYAVYSMNGGADKDYLFSPYLDIDMLNEFLEPHIKQEYRIDKPKFEDKQYPPNPSLVEMTAKWKPYIKPNAEIIDIKQYKKDYFILEGDDSEYVDY